MKHFKIFGIAALLLMAPLACNNYPFGHDTFAPAPPPNAAAATVTMGTISAFDFDDDFLNNFPVTIRPGGQVTWQNSSGFPHTVEMGNGAGGCNPDVFIPDTTSYILSFPVAGTYYYRCSLHGYCGSGFCDVSCNSGMVGTIVVQ